MSRIAKIAAMCFVRRGQSLAVVKRGSTSTLQRHLGDSYGCPFLRGVSRICAVSQQSALDSHRVSKDSIPAHDMISDLFQGGDTTLVMLPAAYRGMPPLIWSCHRDGITIGILDLKRLELATSWPFLGSYSPAVLSLCSDKFGVCSKALTLLCVYFDIPIHTEELNDMTHMFSYEVELSTHPITTSAGMLARGMGWVDTLMANSYGTIKVLGNDAGGVERPYTGTSAMLCGNYTKLN